jgi:hypothetical protein
VLNSEKCVEHVRIFLSNVKQAGMVIHGEPLLLARATAAADWREEVATLSCHGRSIGVVMRRRCCPQQFEKVLCEHAFSTAQREILMANTTWKLTSVTTGILPLL